MIVSVVKHIRLCVHDIDRSRGFYEQLFGFEYKREIAPPDDPAGRLLQLKPPLGLRAVYLRKDGLLLEGSDIGVAVFIRDPDGQLVELLETELLESKGAGRA